MQALAGTLLACAPTELDPDVPGGADMTTTPTRVHAGLEEHGLDPIGTVVWSPTTAQLYTAALKSGDGALAHGGPLVVDTGKFTGRSPKDKFVVDEPGSQERIWWGEINHPLPEDRFHGLRTKVVEHLDAQAPLYVVDAFAGADPAHRIGVRVVTGSPYHALFAKTMFITPHRRAGPVALAGRRRAARARGRGRPGGRRHPLAARSSSSTRRRERC